MNVAYINADAGIPLFSGKGAAVHVRDVASALVAMDHAVHVFTARAGAPAEGWTIPFDCVTDGTTAGGAAAAPPAHASNARMRRVLDSRSAGAEAKWDLIYERYSLWSYAGLAFARRRGLPFVLEVNSPLVVEQSRYRTLEHAVRARRVERYLFRGATRIVAVSSEVAEYVCAQGADPSRVVVAANGVDLGLYAGASVSTPGEERFTIGFLGSLKPWHGVDLLVETLEQLVARDARYHLRVIGDGPERARVEAALDARRLAGHATLVGQVDRHAVPAELAQVDCAVAPYPRLDDFYFSPLKVFEYMAAGRPIVASRIGQIESVLEDGETALLVEPGNPAALADAIHALRTDPATATRLATTARGRAFERHGWTHTLATSLDGVMGGAR
ncbi:MAG: glycosyltransferase family 4 protein [Vicinamibacterales bacterium]